MAKLLQRKSDGAYYTKVSIGQNRIITYQIHPQGLIYLFQHNVRVGMQIPGSCRRVLWEQKWFYTKGEQPRFGVVDDLVEGEGVREVPHGPVIVDEVPAPPSRAHADRPAFLFDRATTTYYTVLHLNGGQVHTEPTVMCIKYRRAKQIMADHGAKVGQELPAGVFEMIFLNRWFYPKPGWTPREARPLPLSREIALTWQRPDQENLIYM